MLDPRQIASFLAVVQSGSFVAAAEALGLSKAAVSRQVAELEAQLGVRLLQRTTRRLSLTEAGQRFRERAGELVDAWAELETDTAQSAGQATGLLRINAPLTFGNLHLAPLWGRFLDQNPALRLLVDLNDRVVDLVEEGYDLAIRIGRPGDSRLVARRLASTRMRLCASPGYLARRGHPAHPRELAAHRVIAYRYWSDGDDWSFRGDPGEVRVRVQPCLRTNSGDTCRIAALAGQGVILQPDFLVGGDLRTGRLIELLPEWRTMDLDVQAIFPSRTHLPLKTRRLIDYLVEAFHDPRWSAPVG